MKKQEMKRGKTMLITILAVIVSLSIIAYLGRGQTLSVLSIDKLEGDLSLIHLAKPDNMQWKAGAHAKISLPNSIDNHQTASEVVTGASKSQAKDGESSRWLTIASSSNEDEILILTHNSGSPYKKSLTNLPAGSKVELSWLDSTLSTADSNKAFVCFASDVGIAAIRPIIKEEISKRELVLSHLSKGVMVFNNELEDSAKKHANLSYESSSSLSQSQDYLSDAVERYGNDATYLLAGQADDVNAMTKFLEDKGIDKKKIKTSRFRGLK